MHASLAQVPESKTRGDCSGYGVPRREWQCWARVWWNPLPGVEATGWIVMALTEEGPAPEGQPCAAALLPEGETTPQVGAHPAAAWVDECM